MGNNFFIDTGEIINMAESISKCKFTKSFCKLLHQE